jgi:ParB-like chromosome segregation protein Spo0J
MAQVDKAVRQSVTVPRRVAERVRALAKRQRTSANRVLVELIEAGLDAKEAEKRRFFELADRLTESDDAGERRRLKDELARMTFGE